MLAATVSRRRSAAAHAANLTPSKSTCGAVARRNNAVIEGGVAQVAFPRTPSTRRADTSIGVRGGSSQRERPDQEATHPRSPPPPATSTELTVDAWATCAAAAARAIYQFFICNQSLTGVLAISGAGRQRRISRRKTEQFFRRVDRSRCQVSAAKRCFEESQRFSSSK